MKKRYITPRSSETGKKIKLVLLTTSYLQYGGVTDSCEGDAHDTDDDWEDGEY